MQERGLVVHSGAKEKVVCVIRGLHWIITHVSTCLSIFWDNSGTLGARVKTLGARVIWTGREKRTTATWDEFSRLQAITNKALVFALMPWWQSPLYSTTIADNRLISGPFF